MYHHEFPLTPSQQAVIGALDAFVDGARHNDVRQQLFGLSVLKSATETQVLAAMPAVEASQRVSLAEIHALLAR